MALPPLRQELALMPGPPLADGQPTQTLHDPVRNLYFQLDWPTVEILARWSLGDMAAIAAAVSAETTLQLSAADVERVAQFFADNELLQPSAGASHRLAERTARRRGSPLARLLHNYLFFRVPLWRPDTWLTRWRPTFDIFFSRSFRLLTLLALLLGLIEVARDWNRFTATLIDTLSVQGLVSYGLALIAVKFAHELGHALAAKRCGCRVPTMGVAFLVLWPVAFTDTNDVWQLRSKSQRLGVAAAGIVTELTIAAWATFLWAWLPEGLPKSIAFLLATTTWISTLLINASPFMRFDGYFLLSDYLKLPNLHARAFALARWHLREALFDLRAEPPEHFVRRRRRFLIAFAWAVWIYRLVLFLGIAALVYHFFIKAVGILLFAVEIGVFVLLPIVRELREWRRSWPTMRVRRRTWVSAGIAATALLLLAVPLPTRIHTSALLQPQQRFAIYAPENAYIDTLPIQEGQHVEADTVLLRMSSPQLQWREQRARARWQQAQWLAEAGVFDAEQRARWQTSQAEFAGTEAELQSIAVQAGRYAPRAPFDGELRDLDPELRKGQWVSANERLGVLVAQGRAQVIAYVDEQTAGDIETGARAMFYADGLPALRLTVARIDTDASRTLAEPELAANHGGDLLARENNGILYPEHALFRVVLDVDADLIRVEQLRRGRLTITAQWTPPARRFARAALALLWREAGF